MTDMIGAYDEYAINGEVPVADGCMGSKDYDMGIEGHSKKITE